MRFLPLALLLVAMPAMAQQTPPPAPLAPPVALPPQSVCWTAQEYAALLQAIANRDPVLQMLMQKEAQAQQEAAKAAPPPPAASKP